MIGSASFVSSQDQLRVSAFFSKVYIWMTGALGVSALVAWYTAQSGLLLNILKTSPGLIYGALIAEVVVVLALTWGLSRMSVGVASLMFVAYAALTGFTLSTIFLAYTMTSIATTFLLTGVTYGAMGMYGFATSRNLGAWGGFLFMSLIGIILASLVNLFLHSAMIDWMMAYAGVVVFAGLTAYDHQKLKAMCLMSGEQDFGRLSIYGALNLYLDFINLFLSLLRIFGRQRN